VARIAIIGAGGYAFPVTICRDILSFEELAGAELRLMDINEASNSRTLANVEKLVEAHGLPAKVTATTDLDEALDGAGYAVVTWQVGGIDAYELDVEIPRRHGLDQPVGDTMGPGGVFRFLRSFPAYRKLAETMKRHCPDALLINYANPMAMNCMALNRMGVKAVGLCHSVQGTSHLLAKELGIPPDELEYKVAGFKHQAWYTELRHRGEDVYPRLREAMSEKYPSPAAAKAGYVAGATGEVDESAGHGEGYHQEKVRAEIMRTFGYFHTESSHHGSEYVTWIRKSKEMVDSYIDERWDYYEICRNHDFEGQEKWVAEKLATEPLKSSHEYGAAIIHSMETGERRVIYGSVPNWGPPGSSPDAARALLVPNLQWDAAVEIACLVDRNGVQPVSHGALPTQCAALNRSCINVHELAVEAAFTGDASLVHMAVAVDPLTAAVMTLPQIRAMVDEMLEAQRDYLPQLSLLHKPKQST
jgi:alpha-galactosidase